MDKVLTVLAETIEYSIFPLVRHMDKKLEIDLGTYNKMKEIAGNLRELQSDVDIIGKESKASATKLVALSRKPRPACARKKTHKPQEWLSAGNNGSTRYCFPHLPCHSLTSSPPRRMRP